jgi:hypothetical protein
MAPKKVKKGTVLEPLPLVGDKELEAAKQKLEDKVENNRLRSQMLYWLSQNKQDQAYKMASPKVRKSYFDQWVAVQMSKGERSGRHSRTASKSKIVEEEEVWVAKEEMILTLGPNRAQALIDSNKLDHHPRRKTGLDDEWNRQYKQEKDKVIHRGDETTRNEVESHRTELDDTAFKELLDDLTSLEALDSGGDLSKLAALKEVKVEGGAAMAPAGILPPKAEEKDSATFTALKTAPKTVVKNVQEALLELKEVWKESKDNRMAGVIHEDATKLMPKFAKIYKSVESALIDKVTDEATLLALSKKVDEHFNSYNDLIEWHHKLMPKEQRKKKARIS